LYVVFPLVVGCLPYALCRNLSWLRKIITPIRNNCLCDNEYIVFSLPDGLWLFAFTNLVFQIWERKINNKSFIWIFFIPVIAVLSEILQYTRQINGTFDLIDILTYILFTLLFSCCSKLCYKNDEKN
jgi:hypothetical protein